MEVPLSPLTLRFFKDEDSVLCTVHFESPRGLDAVATHQFTGYQEDSLSPITRLTTVPFFAAFCHT